MLSAIDPLDQHPDYHIKATSAVYESPAMGPPQPDYLNSALRLHIHLPLQESTPAQKYAQLDALWHRLHAIEIQQGRMRTQRWGPRTLDLDILWCNQGAVLTPYLRIPHPGLQQRNFALAPLLDVAPELVGKYAPYLDALGGAPKKVGQLR